MIGVGGWRRTTRSRGKVVAYSAHEDSIIDAASDLWEETHPDEELEIIRMGSGDVINRVQAESENPQADVIWSIRGERLEANSDLLADYEPGDWDMIENVKPHQIYAAGDLSDPLGTHGVCLEGVLQALEQLKSESWMQDCWVWLYRGAWQEWDIDQIELGMAECEALEAFVRYQFLRP